MGTVEQAAEAIRPYIEAGFTGFTFNNNLYKTPEQIEQLGDLLKPGRERNAGRSAVATVV